MTIPFKDWSLFDNLAFRAEDLDSHNYNLQADWDSDRKLIPLRIGEARYTGGYNYRYYKVFTKPRGSDFELVEGLDKPADVKIVATVAKDQIVGVTSGYLQILPIQDVDNDSYVEIDYEKATGHTYDGVNGYPGTYGSGIVNEPGKAVSPTGLSLITWSLPSSIKEALTYWYAYSAGQWIGYSNALRLFCNGMKVQFFTAGWDHALLVGDEAIMIWSPQSLRVRFYNPIVNSFSRYTVPTAGGVALSLYGICLNPTDAELSVYGGSIPSGGFNMMVDKIDFVGLQGQGTTTIYKTTDYTFNGDGEIVISSMPSLTAGTYRVRLSKWPTGWATFGYNTAGLWRAGEDGRVFQGNELILRVSDDDDEDDDDDPVVLTKWKWKKRDGSILFKWYSEIDVSGPATFYDGRILNVSSLVRGVDAQTGLFTISDLEIELSNADNEFSTLLAEYYLKNQIVEISIGWESRPEGWKWDVMYGVVIDNVLKGDSFTVRIRDLSQKYFDFNVPLFRVTEDEYPDLHDSAIGREFPEVLGNASHTGSEAAGAVEAIYVDTVNYIYLAARGPLYEITAVYADGTLVSTAGYSVFYADEGRTYIQFTSDRGDSKITFNAKGYVYSDWNSINGYVQNPAYILLFYLAFIAEIPATEINLDSFNDLADLLEDLGASTDGMLIIQDSQDVKTPLGELLYTIGSYGYPDRYGRFTVVRKGLSQDASHTRLFAQIDLLDDAERKFNYDRAINYINAKYAFIPTAGLFKGSKTGIRIIEAEDYAEDYDANIAEDLEFKWYRGEGFINTRIAEILSQRAEGDREVNFPVHISRSEDFDLMDDIVLQDPKGIGADGGGIVSEYMFIKQITLDFMGGSLFLVNARTPVTIFIEAAVSGSATVTGDLTRIRAGLAGSISGSGSAVATLDTVGGLAGSATGSATVSGNLTII